MNNETDIDWSTAPEGATQYAAGSNSPWEKVVDDVMYYWHSPPGWIKYSRGNPSYRRNLIYRPTEPQWDGKGLPPVGTVCECGESYKSGIIKCHLISSGGEPMAIIGYERGYNVGFASDFRLIKSERKRAIEEMLSLDCEPSQGMLSRTDFCGNIYDAGWRKP